VTGIITAEDHGDGYHVTDITVVQQQSEDLEPAGKLNQNNR